MKKTQILRGRTNHRSTFLRNFAHGWFSRGRCQAADLAPAQLEALRPNVVLDSRASCPVSGAAASNGRGCPFRRPMVEGAPLLEKVGGTEEIEKILTLMEREARSLEC